MLLSVLHSWVKKCSDTVLILSTAFVFLGTFLGWYILGYRPLTSKMQSLALQNEQLDKRYKSLEKRTSRFSQVQEQFYTREAQLKKLCDTFPTNKDTLQSSILSLITDSGASLNCWLPGKIERHHFFSSTPVACKIKGSFEQLYKILCGLGSYIKCSQVSIQKETGGLVCCCDFVLLTSKEL